MTSELQPDPRCPAKHIDPQTGIWPISEWGAECRRKFVPRQEIQARRNGHQADDAQAVAKVDETLNEPMQLELEL